MASTLLKLVSPLSAAHAAMGTVVTSEITPRVYISDWMVAQNWDALHSMGITHVVSVCEIPPIVSSSIAHLHVFMMDLPIADISGHFDETTRFIRDALAKDGTKVLVHCLGGLSRSVSVVCAYLIAAKGMTARQAMVYTHDRRAVAHPNIGFRYQLRKYASRYGLNDEDDSEGEDGAESTASGSITSHVLTSLPKLPGSGLLHRGTVRKMVSDSVGRLVGHGGSESEVLKIATVKALGPDWEGPTQTIVTHAVVQPDASVKVDVAVA